MSRFVIIDDTSPRIQYTGQWSEVINTQLETGNEGPPFQNTLHGVNSTGVNAVSAFSFSFSGSAVIVYGTSITVNETSSITTNGTSNTTTVTVTQDPTWECIIDDAIIDSSPPSNVVLGGSENNWILCGVGPDKLQDGPHSLTVNANVTNQNFWFDQIQYAPSANVSLNQSLLRIDASDSAIQYSSGWQFVNNSINYQSAANQFGNYSFTQINGSKLTYEFSGTSISLFGIVSLSTASDPMANATYTIDEQEPITFTVGDDSSTNLFNQMSFETGQLSPGQHNLVVTYLGNTATQPIIVNYFVQQSAPVPPNTPTSSSSPSPTSASSSASNAPDSSSSAPSNSSPGNPTGSIVGGVIGGLVLISLLTALFFFRRRRIIQRANLFGDGM